MSRKILYYFFVIATFLASSVFAATYEDGEVAYESSDYKKAVSIWEALAKEGDITSQLRMAKLYSTGLGTKKDEFSVKKDRSLVFKFYNQAAEQGSAEAQVQLGQIYMSGQVDVKRDPEKARELYLKAAKQGYAKAQYYYGVTYFRGEGVSTDYVLGHAWMHVSLVSGYEPAKGYIEAIEEVLSEADLEKSKTISEQILAEIK